MMRRRHDGDGHWRDDLGRERGDAALWDLLGESKDIRPSTDFTARVLAAVDAEAAQRGLRPRFLIRRWVGATAAAAAAVLLLTIALRDSDGRRPIGNDGDYTAVERELAALDESDLAAFEIDGVASVNEDWFGG